MAEVYVQGEVYTLDQLQQFYEDQAGGPTVISTLINSLKKDDPIMEHMLWRESTHVDGHQYKVVSKIPSPSWRKFYQGVKRSKGEIAMVKEATRQLADRWEIDADLMRLYEGKEAQNRFRMQESELHIQGMKEFVADQLFYGNNRTDNDEILGLSGRYEYKDGPNVVDGGGTTGNQCSIWGLVLGPTEVFGFYPKNMKAGIFHRDLGIFDAEDDSGDPFEAVGDEWKWTIGFGVANYRAAVRICNIQVDKLVDPNAADFPDLGGLMVKAKNKIDPKIRKRMRWYAPNAVMTALELQALNQKNTYLTSGQYLDSMDVMKVHRYPIFECDSLRENESLLSAM